MGSHSQRNCQLYSNNFADQCLILILENTQRTRRHTIAMECSIAACERRNDLPTGLAFTTSKTPGQLFPWVNDYVNYVIT